MILGRRSGDAFFKEASTGWSAFRDFERRLPLYVFSLVSRVLVFTRNWTGRHAARVDYFATGPTSFLREDMCVL